MFCIADKIVIAWVSKFESVLIIGVSVNQRVQGRSY